MDLRAIIDEIARQAEDFPVITRNREQTRADIAELIQADYSHLGPADRKTVAEGVMAVLKDDDFFGVEFASGAFDEEPEGENEF
jgi:hypothetical protein